MEICKVVVESHVIEPGLPHTLSDREVKSKRPQAVQEIHRQPEILERYIPV